MRFFNARNVKQADTHHQIFEVYGENAMSAGMVRKWVRKFNEGHDNMRGEPRSDLLSSQAAMFYEKGIQKLVPRYDKCLNSGGNYVEKWFKVC
jgi:hypothetical protein